MGKQHGMTDQELLDIVEEARKAAARKLPADIASEASIAVREEQYTETHTPLWPMHRLDDTHAHDASWFETWADTVREMVAAVIMEQLSPMAFGDNSFHSRTWRLARMIDDAMFPSDGSKIDADAGARAVAERLLPYAQFWFPELPVRAAQCLVWGLLMERIAVLLTPKDDPPSLQTLIARRSNW